MPVGNWNVEFLNLNSQRNYPLADTASGEDTSGTFKLPDEFLVEADIPVHAGLSVDPARFFVKNIGAYASGFSVVIGYQPVSGEAVTVATALIPSAVHTVNSVYALGGVGDFADTFGKVVIGRLDDIQTQPAGFWSFDFDAGRLDPDAVRPIIRGISSISLTNAGQTSAKIYGDIHLVAGNNCQLVPILAEGADPIIRIDFINGAGTIANCVCEGDATPTTPIARISGIAGTPGGDFTLLGSDCMQITPITNGLMLTNNCAKPCCGCPELERVTNDLTKFGQDKAAVETFANRLGNAVDTMSLTVLGARLGDQSCVSCE